MASRILPSFEARSSPAYWSPSSHTAGLAANDFGDSIRFGAATAEEDEPNLDLMHFDISLYELYVKGYLEETKDVLTEAEIKSLPWGARGSSLLPLEGF